MIRLLILTAAASLAAGFLLPGNGALLLAGLCIVGVALFAAARVGA